MQSLTPLYPYVLDPKLTTQFWGGTELVEIYGKHGDPNAKLGESWECWDTDAVTNGALNGSMVADLRAKLGPAVPRRHRPERIFPILTKIITAHDWLSVQVHPNDAYAQRVEHQPFGKPSAGLCLCAARRRTGAGLDARYVPRGIRAPRRRRHARRDPCARFTAKTATPSTFRAAPCTRSGPASRSSRRSRPATSPTGCSTGTAWDSTESRASCTPKSRRRAALYRRRRDDAQAGRLPVRQSRPHGADRRPALHRRAYRGDQRTRVAGIDGRPRSSCPSTSRWKSRAAIRDAVELESMKPS